MQIEISQINEEIMALVLSEDQKEIPQLAKKRDYLRKQVETAFNEIAP